MTNTPSIVKRPTRICGLSIVQATRLVEALRGSRPANPGISYLADQGFGMRAARPWYQTFGGLCQRGLVSHARYADGSLQQAYRITAAGRLLAAQILNDHPWIAP